MELKPLVQRGRRTCGQTCIAMVTGRPLKEVYAMYGKVRAARFAEIMKGVERKHGKAAADRFAKAMKVSLSDKPVYSTTRASETIRVLKAFGFNVDCATFTFADGDTQGEYHKYDHKEFEQGRTHLVRVAWLNRKGQDTGRTKGGHLLVYRDGWFYNPGTGMLSATPPKNSKITHWVKIWK